MPYSRPALSTLAAAIAATLLLPAPASAAPEPRCQPVLEAVGTGQGALGTGSKRARAAAIADFQQKAEGLYGKRYSSLARARTVKWDCRSGALEAKCVVTARPCR